MSSCRNWVRFSDLRQLLAKPPQRLEQHERIAESRTSRCLFKCKKYMWKLNTHAFCAEALGGLYPANSQIWMFTSIAITQLWPWWEFTSSSSSFKMCSLLIKVQYHTHTHTYHMSAFNSIWAFKLNANTTFFSFRSNFWDKTFDDGLKKLMDLVKLK